VRDKEKGKERITEEEKGREEENGEREKERRE